MSDISATSATTKDPAEIYRLLRERFAPMARFGGPLYAGVYEREGISGTMYVGELNQWLWVPWPETAGSLRPEDALLSDEQVARERDLAATLQSLLRSAKLVFELFLEHLDRVQREPTFTDQVQTYLTDSVALVVDALVVRGRRDGTESTAAAWGVGNEEVTEVGGIRYHLLGGGDSLRGERVRPPNSRGS